MGTRGAVRWRALALPGALVALAVATLALASIDGRVRVTAPDLVPNADFSTGALGWFVRGPARVSGNPPMLSLVARGARSPAWAVTRVPIDPTRYDHVRVDAEVRAQGMRLGDQAWQNAQIRVFGTDAAGRRFRHWPAKIAHTTGTEGWERVSGAVPVNPDAATLWLAVHIAADAGTLQVRRTRVSGGVERAGFTALDTLLIGCWVAAAGLAVALLVPGARRVPGRWPVLATSLVVAIAGTTPQPHYSRSIRALEQATARTWDAAVERLSGTAPRRAPDQPPGEGPGARERSGPGDDAHTGAGAGTGPDPDAGRGPASGRAARSGGEGPRRPSRRVVHGQTRAPGALVLLEVSDRAGHVGAFALLSFLAGLAYPRTPGRRVVALVAFSASIQLVQTLAVGREPDLADVLADAQGIGAGTVLAWAVLGAWTRVRRRTG